MPVRPVDHGIAASAAGGGFAFTIDSGSWTVTNYGSGASAYTSLKCTAGGAITVTANPAALTWDVLYIGGGGGATAPNTYVGVATTVGAGGGGGGGGMDTDTGLTVNEESYTAVIGAGGASSTYGDGSQGNLSSFGPTSAVVTRYGGGAGNRTPNQLTVCSPPNSGTDAGSAGGPCSLVNYNNQAYTGDGPVSGGTYGNSSGQAASVAYLGFLPQAGGAGGGGRGGGGGYGSVSTTAYGGLGGSGSYNDYFDGTVDYYAGGGGGTCGYSNGAGGGGTANANGGGGDGMFWAQSSNPTRYAGAGTANSGGGGGGGGVNHTGSSTIPMAGGYGGSGVIIVRILGTWAAS